MKKQEFIPNLKELSKNPQRLAPGYRTCPGCGLGVIMRQVMTVTKYPIVAATATGCFEICTGAYPFTSWKIPWIHSLFENTAAVISGAEAMHKALMRKGKLSKEQKKIKFLACGGDGGTYDIGLQSLSGAVERGHDIVYICLDNEGYMNTGYQRSSATPKYAHTTTSQVGEKIPGKPQNRKDLTMIMAAHHIPYVAQAAPSNWADLMKKAHRAFEVEGPAFINTLSVCPTNWKTETTLGMKITQTAVDTCFWPLYEVDHGVLEITYKPARKLPITEWLKDQKRFRHLFKPENKKLIKIIQEEVDREWKNLLELDKKNIF